MKVYLVFDLSTPQSDGAEAAVVGAYSTAAKAKRALMRLEDGDIAVLTIDERAQDE